MGRVYDLVYNPERGLYHIGLLCFVKTSRLCFQTLLLPRTRQVRPGGSRSPLTAVWQTGPLTSVSWCYWMTQPGNACKLPQETDPELPAPSSLDACWEDPQRSITELPKSGVHSFTRRLVKLRFP